MMFQSNSELPVNVRRALPDAEQTIFRDAYNKTGSLEYAWRSVEDSESVRWFTCYASIQQVDSAGEMFSIDALAAAMPDYIRRGGPMFYEHRAYEIGTAYRGEPTLHEKTGLPAIKLYCASYLDCRIADRAWAKIKSGEFPDVSIGGDALSQYWKCDDKSCYNFIDRVDWFDTSPTRKGANPGSSIIDVNLKAKAQEAPVAEVACSCNDKGKMADTPPSEGTPAPAPDDAGLVVKSDDPQVVEQLLQKVLAMFSEIKNALNNVTATQRAPEGQDIENAVDGGEMPVEAAEGGAQEEVPPTEEKAEEMLKEGVPEQEAQEPEAPENATPPKEDEDMPDDEKMKQKSEQEMAEAKVAEVKEMKAKAETAVMTPRPGMAEQPSEMFAKKTMDWNDPATQRRIARTPARDLIRGILKD
jgi:hypothetical protein